MVKFNQSNGKGTPDSFTITAKGQKDEYIETIQALTNVLGGVEADFLTDRDRYLICSLIADMLPNPEQIVDIEDMELLTKAKKNRILINQFLNND